MKKTELLEIIKIIVKDEVEKSLPQYLMEVLAKKIISNDEISKINEPAHINESQIKEKQSIRSTVQPETTSTQPTKNIKTYAKDPVLNRILNETVGGIPQEAPSTIDALTSLPADALNENKEVAAVVKAVTRDYSQLLNEIDARKSAKK